MPPRGRRSRRCGGTRYAFLSGNPLRAGCTRSRPGTRPHERRPPVRGARRRRPPAARSARRTGVAPPVLRRSRRPHPTRTRRPAPRYALGRSPSCTFADNPGGSASATPARRGGSVACTRVSASVAASDSIMTAEEPAVPVPVPGHPYEKPPAGPTGRPGACSGSPSFGRGAPGPATPGTRSRDLREQGRAPGTGPGHPVRGRPSAPRSPAPDAAGSALRAAGAAFGTRPGGSAAPHPGRPTGTGAW